jgi:predicted metal-dependent phosphoesterase TrpH
MPELFEELTDEQGFVDLHVHTTASDSLLSPPAVVDRAEALGFSALGIADHDSLDGMISAKAYSKKVEIVPAFELSCIYGGIDIHLLGYCIDYENEELNRFLAKVQKIRKERAEKIIRNLAGQNVEIELDRVLELAQGGSVGRPHIAQAIVEKGYAGSFNEVFYRFIGYHCPAYVPKMEITPKEGVALVKKFGGAPVLAHPGIYRKDELIDYLIPEGLAGIEVWHPEHSASESRRYLDLTRERGLVATGGSDCHGGIKGKIFLGEVKVPLKYYLELKNLTAARK